MYIDLRQLRHVIALDQYRSFARAAEAIGLTQPALTRSIQVLERSIGARLFDRDRAGVEPTQVGERLIARAKPLLSQARDIEQDLNQMLGLEAGMLRIGAGPYAADISVGTAAGRLLRRHPGLQVEISVGDWPALAQRVLSGELDLAVAETALALEDARLTVDSLPAHQAVVVCRPGHPLANRADPTLHDLRRYPFVASFLPARMAPLARRMDVGRSSSQSGGVASPWIRVETVNLAWRIIMETDAIGGAVLSQVEDEIAFGRLVTLPIQLPWFKTSYGIIRLANRTLSPAASALMEILKEIEAGIA